MSEEPWEKWYREASEQLTADLRAQIDTEAGLAEIVKRAKRVAAIAARLDWLSTEDAKSTLGEGIHTAFRKAIDSPAAVGIHQAIEQLPPREWDTLIGWIVDSLEVMNIRLVQVRPEARSDAG